MKNKSRDLRCSGEEWEDKSLPFLVLGIIGLPILDAIDRATGWIYQD